MVVRVRFRLQDGGRGHFKAQGVDFVAVLSNVGEKLAAKLGPNFRSVARLEIAEVTAKAEDFTFVPAK